MSYDQFKPISGLIYMDLCGETAHLPFDPLFIKALRQWMVARRYSNELIDEVANYLDPNNYSAIKTINHWNAIRVMLSEEEDSIMYPAIQSLSTGMDIWAHVCWIAEELRTKLLIVDEQLFEVSSI